MNVVEAPSWTTVTLGVLQRAGGTAKTRIDQDPDRKSGAAPIGVTMATAEPPFGYCNEESSFGVFTIGTSFLEKEPVIGSQPAIPVLNINVMQSVELHIVIGEFSIHR